MDEFTKLMSDTKFYEGYSRYDVDLGRYENWNEATDRVMDMHYDRYSNKLTKELKLLMEEVDKGYKDKLFLGSQRALQFGGEQLKKHVSRLFNCTASYCNRPNFFGGAFYLLLSGAGVGFSVQKHHIAMLPNIEERKKQSKIYVVPDSIEGWSNAIDILLSSYFSDGGVYPEYRGRKVYFDYSKIRQKGSFISGGWKAPGSEPLKKAISKVEELLENEIKNGETKIRPIVAYDITMHIADAVISGGVRRSATICMFSRDDEDMITAKIGDWFISNPQRSRSNNSAVLPRGETTREEFANIMESVKDIGEPGFIWTDDLEFLYNPCVEVGLYPQTEDGRSGFGVCNLTEINGSKSTTKEIFFNQCKLASIMGTLQAGYTDFKFLKDATREIVERDSLIGVGITGMMNNPNILFNEEILIEGAKIVKYWNKKVSNIIGINQAQRTTVIKPSGNSSVLLGCSSGIHGSHSKRYIRHVQFNKETEIARLMLQFNPEMCENSVWSDNDIVVAFPIDGDDKSLYKKDLLGVKQLGYVKKVQQTWIEEGTNKEISIHPKLRHNVSNTITVDNWEDVEDYIFNNQDYLCGVSLLSSSGDLAYPQAPFREVLTHEEIIQKYGEISLFTSALIEAGQSAFNGDLWNACNTALGVGEKLTESHSCLLKRDFVRRFNKFATNFESKEECSNCLKYVSTLHKWWRVRKNISFIDWENELTKQAYIDADTLASQGCQGGQCEV